jgi:uncharacterized membrane protein
MADNAATCPACGKAAAAAGGGGGAAPAASGGLDDNIAALLGYLIGILSIVWLILEPYKNRPFVRFHAFQCLVFWGSFVVASIAITILSIMLAFVPGVGGLLAGVLWFAIYCGGFVIWIVLMVKAYQGEKWKIPVIGNFAQKLAGG